jgi:hypothetical protein
MAIAHRKTPTVVSLEIAEHIGDQDRRSDLRHKMMSRLNDTFGTATARSFINSAARAKLWGILEREALNPEAAERIRVLRARLDASVADDGTVTLDLSAMKLSDLRISLSDVQYEMQSEFPRSALARGMAVADLTRLPDSEDPTSLTIGAALRRSPRQEERLAIWLRALILYPEAALQALEDYNEPAQMARDMMSFLNAQLRDHLSLEREQAREALVASLMSAVISQSYPRRRGVLLYYFAHHLGDLPSVAAQVVLIVAKSGARDIVIMRDKIVDTLAARKLTRGL